MPKASFTKNNRNVESLIIAKLQAFVKPVRATLAIIISIDPIVKLLVLLSLQY